MHYLSSLQPHLAHQLLCVSERPQMLQSPADPVSTPGNACPIVVLGGYSYGSLILRHLPPVPTILKPFAAPEAGSAADEIVLRSHKLADQTNMEWVALTRDETRARKPKAKQTARPSITMGGEETSPGKRRSSREIRRSFEGTRLEIRSKLRRLSHGKREKSEPTTPPPAVKSEDFAMPDTRYLLISPLTTPISSLAAPALIHRLWGKSKDDGHEIVGKHMCLAIYGNQDIFSSAKKLREWAERLKDAPASRFYSVEVEGAGHFWVEHGVETRLRVALEQWAMDM